MKTVKNVRTVKTPKTMKTAFVITSAAVALGTVALTAGPALAAAPTSGGVVSVTSAKDASAPIYGGSDVHLSGTCPVDAVKLNGISSPFFAGGHATIGKSDPQAFTGSATVLPDIPTGAHPVTVSCTDKGGKTESFTGSFTVSPAVTPDKPVKPVTPVAPVHPTTPTTPTHPGGSGTVPSGAPDTGVAGDAGGGSDGYNPALPLGIAGIGVLGGGTVLGIAWARHHQGTGK